MNSYPLSNRLLLSLPPRNLTQLTPNLEFIRCEQDQILLDVDDSLDHVFFPNSGVISVVAVYSDGNVIEMATIGREGCTGVQAFFGARRSSARLLVQIPGSAAKMSGAAFNRAMKSMPFFHGLMSAHVQAFLEQVLVSAACNGRHSLKQRLARWMLMMRDRSDADDADHSGFARRTVGCATAQSHSCGGGVGGDRFDPARSTADHDPRPAGPNQSIVRMLSTCSRACRISPSAVLR